MIKVSLSSLKINSRTLFKVKIQNKMQCAQFRKIKGLTWQKDAFSDDTVGHAPLARIDRLLDVRTTKWQKQLKWPCSVDRSRTVGDARAPANVCLWRPAAWTNRREHLIVRIGISEAETTNNKRHALVVLYWMLVAMLRVCITDTKHRAASLLQQSFLFSQLLWVWFNCQCNQLPGKLIFTVACYVSSVALNLLPRSTLYFLGNL